MTKFACSYHCFISRCVTHIINDSISFTWTHSELTELGSVEPDNPKRDRLSWTCCMILVPGFKSNKVEVIRPATVLQKASQLPFTCSYIVLKWKLKLKYFLLRIASFKCNNCGCQYTFAAKGLFIFRAKTKCRLTYYVSGLDTHTAHAFTSLWRGCENFVGNSFTLFTAPSL